MANYGILLEITLALNFVEFVTLPFTLQDNCHFVIYNILLRNFNAYFSDFLEFSSFCVADLC